MFGGDDCVLFKDKEWKIEMSFPRRCIGVKLSDKYGLNVCNS